MEKQIFENEEREIYGYCVVVMLSGRNGKLFHPNRVHRSRIVDTIEEAERIKSDWVDWGKSGLFELKIITLCEFPGEIN